MIIGPSLKIYGVTQADLDLVAEQLGDLNELPTTTILMAFAFNRINFLEERIKDLETRRNMTIDSMLYQKLVSALKAAKGDFKVAAQALGIGRMELYRHVKNFGILPKEYT